MNTSNNVLLSYQNAGYPVVAVETPEEARLLQECKQSLTHNNKIWSIAAAGGLIDEATGKAINKGMKYNEAFVEFQRCDDSFLLIFDFQHMISSATSYRPLLQVLDNVKLKGSMIVLVSPFWRLPEELKHIVPVISYSLPTAEELRAPLDVALEVTDTKGEDLEKIDIAGLISAARGLTINEAENVFALSALSNYSKTVVEREKMRIVKSEYMSVERPRPVSQLGGLGRLKKYIADEVIPSRDDEQLRVKGILLVGVPGTGKSLTSRVVSSLLEWPLVRFDVSAAKGSLVGQSESNVRKALAMADAISPCVLWMDEIEKAIGGHGSSAQTDGGTTLGMLGSILTWMQEHDSPVFVVATCNDYSKLPPELTRAGRFDERFFLDIPSSKEREAIAKLHMGLLRCPDAGDMLADTIAELTEGFTGAEIEQLIKSTARQTGRKPNVEILTRESYQMIPISRSKNIEALREWAKINLRPANDEDQQVHSSSRKVRK